MLALAMTARNETATAADYPGALSPPPGTTPDLAHHYDSDRVADIVVLVLCLLTTTFFFASRICVKILASLGFLFEDVTCTFGYILGTVYALTMAYRIHYGEGYHEWDLSRNDDMMIRKWLYVASCVYCPAAYFIKSTLLLLVARVFSIRERFAQAMRISVGVLVLFYFPMQVLKMRACNPIRKYWYPAMPGTCLDMSKIYMADSCLALVTDLIILVIPIPLTWTLKLSVWQRMKIWGLLGAGGAATGMTAYRIFRVWQLIHSADRSFILLRFDIMTLLELSIGLTCACLPHFRILLQHIQPQAPKPSPNVPRTGNNVRRRYKSHGQPLESGTTMSTFRATSSKSADEGEIREIPLTPAHSGSESIEPLRGHEFRNSGVEATQGADQKRTMRE